MTIGCPKEIKQHEYRVGLAPSSVRSYTGQGHTVLVQAGAGTSAGHDDASYRQAGAKIVVDVREICETSDMIVKVKEPQPSEYGFFHKGQILFTYLHLAADSDLTQAMAGAAVKAVAYETIETEDHQLPLLKPMSEIAGRLSVQQGAKCLENPHFAPISTSPPTRI